MHVIIRALIFSLIYSSMAFALETFSDPSTNAYLELQHSEAQTEKYHLDLDVEGTVANIYTNFPGYGESDITFLKEHEPYCSSKSEVEKLLYNCDNNNPEKQYADLRSYLDTKIFTGQDDLSRARRWNLYFNSMVNVGFRPVETNIESLKNKLMHREHLGRQLRWGLWQGMVNNSLNHMIVRRLPLVTNGEHSKVTMLSEEVAARFANPNWHAKLKSTEDFLELKKEQLRLLALANHQLHEMHNRQERMELLLAGVVNLLIKQQKWLEKIEHTIPDVKKSR
jgi:hypothetical protein